MSILLVIVLSFITAFTLTYFAIPPIIHIALEKNLVDEPGERRSHDTRTPSLGGIAIFAGIIFSLVMWTPFNQFSQLQYILGAFIILFLIGAKDDISPVAANKKIIAQLIAATILVLKANIQLTSLYGLLGIDGTLPNWIYIVVSIFTIFVIINAFNLIDGINGLAGSLAILISGTLGAWFFMAGRMEFATLAFSTSGAVLAFLRYNYTPAKIFMGDTGSLILGMVCAILVIKFIDLNYHLQIGNPYRFNAVPAVAIGIMILPLFDTLRVFTTRIIRGNSPFRADRRHIHHLLIDYGYSHMSATAILIFVNAFFIVLVFSLDKYMVDMHIILLFIILISTTMTFYLHKSVLRKNKMNNKIAS